MKVSIITLGCPKNLVEAEKIIGKIEDKVELTGAEDADILILKTCGFIKEAIEESEGWIRRLIDLKRNGKQLIVVGCLVNRFGENLKERFPEIDHLVDLKGEMELNRILGLPPSDDKKRAITTYPYAYLKIGDGCDNRCHYCTIPMIRGNFHSLPIEHLVCEAKALAHAGIKELILVAQDTGYYGQDLASRPLLPELLDYLSEIEGIEWLRIMYLHPAHITDELITRIEGNSRICRYLDVPIQHCSDNILKKMGRKVKKSDLVELFSKLREIPDLSLRTTLMVGFPGETDEDFGELCAFVEEVGFEHFGIFPYSPEPETGAYCLPDRIGPEKIAERVARLEELRDRITHRYNQSFVGKRVKILVDGDGKGRREFDAPEIDSLVSITDKTRIGEFVEVKIDSAQGWRLKGILCR
ncbi:MAG TPA: 30S ribosomal protein S12 methylthiotransferase RimO [bacterium (Candidatus Stahlbacteria)]|nr:30S ribosomal protein S12 methylthiotransferase RimO [Candidatus Stahlbacteria bacterium]